MFQGIDFSSDTVTKPSLEMRKAMLTAEVGDEQRGEDPTTLELEQMMAEMLGFESALFFPSATMANEIALCALSERGDELIAAENCHLFFAETGGPAFFSSLLAKPIPSLTGVFGESELKKQFTLAKGPNFPISRLVSVENTTNMGGGCAWPMDKLREVTSFCRKNGMNSHMDGSRFFNAVVATGKSPKEIAQGFTMVTICLSKGLGCPMGAVLCFPKERFPQIRRLKQLFGGALRQSGIVAMAGIYALKNNISRLEEDHKNARRLEEGLAALNAFEVESVPLPTNLVFFAMKEANQFHPFLEKCTQKGVRFSQVGENRIRAVTHLDISKGGIETTLRTVKEIVG